MEGQTDKREVDPADVFIAGNEVFLTYRCRLKRMGAIADFPLQNN